LLTIIPSIAIIAAAYILLSMVGGVSHTLIREEYARIVLGATVVGGLVIL
jgi:hypothetical protein